MKQTLIVFTSGNPSALFEQLINPKVEPQFKPTQQTQGLDANPNHPVLTGSQKKLFLKDFHAGCFGKAANNLFNTSPLKSYAVDNKDLKKKCEAFFSPFTEGSPSYLDTMRPGSTRWHGTSELISALDLDRAVRALPVTANGITGWSAALLKQLLAIGGSLVKTSLLYIVQTIAKNHLPLGVANFLTSNFLILLLKPNGTDRPISVGDIFIRLVGAALLYNIRLVIPKYMWVSQLGLTTKGTCELANLISYLFIDFLPALKARLTNISVLPPALRDHIFSFFMDLRNCYGNINKHVFIQILNEDPELFTLASYVALIYARQSTIFFSLSKERRLLCAFDVAENGAFQGEALAAFISCVVLNHVIRLSLVDFTDEDKAGICVASIIDDTTIHGTAPLLVNFFKNFNYNLLHLKTGIINTAKSNVIGPTESTSCPNLSVYQELAHNLTQQIHPGSSNSLGLHI